MLLLNMIWCYRSYIRSIIGRNEAQIFMAMT
jgi:hypothetical protein